MFAHKKEELPPNYKMMICTNWAAGCCRKQVICTMAHGEAERTWFTEFLTGKPSDDVAIADAPKAATPAIADAPASNPSNPFDMQNLDSRLLAAAEGQLVTGKAEGPRMAAPKMQPSAQPKINLANNPALRAAALRAGIGVGAVSKGGGGPPQEQLLAGFAKGAPPNMSPPGMSPPGMSPPGLDVMAAMASATGKAGPPKGMPIYNPPPGASKALTEMLQGEWNA
jgi:hypothetical protein